MKCTEPLLVIKLLELNVSTDSYEKQTLPLTLTEMESAWEKFLLLPKPASGEVQFTKFEHIGGDLHYVYEYNNAGDQKENIAYVFLYDYFYGKLTCCYFGEMKNFNTGDISLFFKLSN